MPAASSGRCAGGFTGGGCDLECEVRCRCVAGIGAGVGSPNEDDDDGGTAPEGRTLSAWRAGSVMSNRSIALEM